MPATAKIILDSVSQTTGRRITTMELRYWRAIHAEVMTHRVFSRNASSSRAIPTGVMIRQVEEDPAGPSYWGKNQRGMQAGDELSPAEIIEANLRWDVAVKAAVSQARNLQDLGLHKQIVNRVLEPFSYITVVVTSTQWNNFFALRNHADAQPEIKDLAIEMFTAMCNSEPQLLEHGRWHLPYAHRHTDRETALRHLRKGDLGYANFCGYWDDDVTDLLKKMSAARCARVSYLTHDRREPSVEDDLKLYSQLVENKPVHASPTEHQATPDRRMFPGCQWEALHAHGNFNGWIQHRQLIPDHVTF